MKVYSVWRKKRRKTAVREVLNVTELGSEEKMKEYQKRMNAEYCKIKNGPVGRIEAEWGRFKEVVLRCAGEVCGMKPVGGGVKRRSEWWNDEVREAVRGKRVAFEEWLREQSAVNYGRYRVQRNRVKEVVKVAKREANERWGRRIGADFEGNKKMFWKEVKRLREGDGGSEEKVNGRDRGC